MRPLIVCPFGGRAYNDMPHEYGVLDAIHLGRTIERIIHGAATGADLLGQNWAMARQVRYEGFPARWRKLGRAAGHERNERVVERLLWLREHGCDIVPVAFPGGPGTGDMWKQCSEAGLSPRVCCEAHPFPF